MPSRPEYLYDPPTERQRKYMQLLADEIPTNARTDLVCPDCGGTMVLKIGRYGRFYGCRQYDSTGCQGSHSAKRDGAPKGIPGDKRTRQLRRQIIDRLTDLKIQDPEADIGKRFKSLWQLTEHDELKIGRMDADTCQRALVLIETRVQEGPLSRYDRILLDEDESHENADAPPADPGLRPQSEHDGGATSDGGPDRHP